MDARIKQSWRIVVLVILVVGSIGFVTGVADYRDDPDLPANAVAESQATNLVFGLELAGGTRIRAPLIGYTVDNVEVDPTDAVALERRLADQMPNASPPDITVRARPEDGPGAASIEVTSPDVSQDEFETGLRAENISFETTRSGVTPETFAETIRVLNDKVNQAGLSGGSARELQSSSGEQFVLIEVPEERRDAVLDVINDRGVVQVDIYYPTVDDTGNLTYELEEAVLEQGDFQQIGGAQSDERLGPHVPVVLNQDAAARFEQTAIATNLAQGGSTCRYETAPEATDACLLTRVDGEVVYSAGMSPDLGQSIVSGTWRQRGSFVLQTTNLTEASELTLHLRAGSLPAALDLDAGTSTYISPVQGEQFKTTSVIIAILAILAVSAKVAYRYRDIRVAIPMILTATSEIVILLGIAALLRYPIDLAVIGGFIAVIGTGVDDLIIIANEVLTKNGDVKSQRVFQARFKKAFWVIGAAAVTTIIAMTPLVFLSLGDLQGFAIFTIIGVIIGVVITRPAYGQILNWLLIDERYE